MEMHRVNSSNIEEIGHDPDGNTLTVRFRNGKRYRYENIDREAFEGLLNAPSVGRHFGQMGVREFGVAVDEQGED